MGKHLEQINNYIEQDPDYNINLCGDYNSRNVLAYERDEEGEVIANIVNHQDEVMDLTFTKKDDINGIKASRIFFTKLLAVTDRHGLFPKLDKNTRQGKNDEDGAILDQIFTNMKLNGDPVHIKSKWSDHDLITFEATMEYKDSNE